MKKRRFFLTPVFVCIISVTALLLSCSRDSDDVIKVGVIAPQTGAYAGFGSGGVFGIKAAVEDINALGGIDVDGTQKRIELLIRDNQSDPNKGGTLAETLITQENVQFIISGEAPPPLHPPVSNVCERYKVPYIAACGPFEPWVEMRNATDTQWQYTWATGMFALNAEAQGDDFRAGKPGYTVNTTWIDMLEQFGPETNGKVALFASDDPDGIGWYNGLPGMIETAGYEAVGVDKKLGFLPAETTDFSSVINEWKREGADILWGNCIPPFFAALWKQCATMGYTPKIVTVGRAALFYQDIAAWGGDLPLGVGTEMWWTPATQEAKGIGETTTDSLVARWEEATGQPMSPAIAPGYRSAQVLIDAITRADSLDAEAVNKALAATDLMTIQHRVKFDKNHFSRTPIAFGQWMKTDDEAGWKLKVVYSKHDFIPKQSEPLFPLPRSAGQNDSLTKR